MRTRITLDDVVEWIFAVLAGSALVLFVFVIAFTFLVYAPMDLRAERRCLAAGYPDHRVTYMLESYCLNLQGDVTVSVHELEHQE